MLAAVLSLGLASQVALGALQCPKIGRDQVGHCAMMCFGDSECAEGEMCCGNGCGRQCTKAVDVTALRCPKLDLDQIGDCAEMCSGDKECGDDEMCCSNGCGHECTKAVRAAPKVPVKVPVAQPLKCPKVDPNQVGICSEECSGHKDCGNGEMCCSNGCGHQCAKGVSAVPIKIPLKPLMCPKVDPNQVGICSEECTFDQECGDGEMCCSNGCGHQCTKAVLAAPKPLMCPKVDPNQVGICSEECSGDKDCGKGEMCCSNGCGHQCTKAVGAALKPPQPLWCPNVDPNQVGICSEECTSVKECGDGEMCCSNGCGHQCTKAVGAAPKPPPQPLMCPKVDPNQVGICSEECTFDQDCGDGEMCCSNGCGHQCTKALPKKQAVPKKPAQPLMCPKVDPNQVGICSEECSSDQECNDGEMCCSNGCGHQCTKAVNAGVNTEMCLFSNPQKCKMMCPPFSCAADECAMRTDNCCTMECRKKPVKDDTPEMCPASKPQRCRKICPDTKCAKGQCLMRNDNCCDLTCENAEEDGDDFLEEEPTEMCPASKPQFCRRMCKATECGAGECLMRNDNCCDLTCEKKEDRPVEAETPMCEGSPDQLCYKLCEEKTCGENQCLMRKGDCCETQCQDIPPKSDSGSGCSWESSVCDPRRTDQCPAGEVCDPKACVPSVCNCEVIDGKPSFMCTADCNPGCVKEVAEKCLGDEDCGFLEECTTDRTCRLVDQVVFPIVRAECEKIEDLAACKSSGCGTKMKKNKCVPKKAKKISCQTVGGNKALCDLLECSRFKKGQCGGKSML